MKFACESCRAQYMISDEKVGPRGVKVRCKKCSHVNIVRRSAPAVDPDTRAAPPAPRREGDSLDDELGAAFDNVVAGTPGPAGAPAPARLPAEPAPAPAIAQQPARAAGPATASGQPAPATQREGSVPADGGGQAVAAAPEAVAGQAPTAEGPSPIGLPGPKLEPTGSRRESHQEQEAAGATAAGEWYVAVDDEQVGPIPFDDVRARWEAGSIGPDTLCWRSGMADWTALSQISELAEKLAPRGGVTSEQSSDTGWLDAAMKPQEAPAAGFKPSAASALASLVEQEMEAAKESEAPEATLERDLPPGAESTGIRTLLRDLPDTDVPAAEMSRLLPLSPAPAAPTPEKSPAAEQRPAATPAKAQEPAPAKGGGAGRWIAAAAALLVVVVAALGARAFLATPEVQEVAAAPAPAPASAPEPEPEPEPAAAEAEAEPEEVADGAAAGGGGSAGAEEDDAAAEEDAESAVAEAEKVKNAEKAAEVEKAVAAAQPPRPEPAKAKAPVRTKPKQVKRSAPRRTASKPAPTRSSSDGDLLDAAGSSSIDSLFAQEFSQPAKRAPKSSGGGTYIPPAPGSGGKPASLSQGDIAGVVVGHKAALKSCATEYKSSSGKGSGTVVMRWTIEQDGRTSGVRAVKGTEHQQLAGCIGKLVKGWKFPAYSGPRMKPIDFPFQF